MDNGEFIQLEVFCRNYGVTLSFVNSMQEFGLLEITLINEIECIPMKQLSDAEKLVRLHNDLEINTEGIDVIVQLLNRLDKMQEEMLMLKQRLSFYENEM